MSFPRVEDVSAVLARVNKKDLYVDLVRNYMTKMVGVDFLVKLLGYVVRFKILFLTEGGAAADPLRAGQLSAYKGMLASIVESRMLSNSVKGPSTLKSALRALTAPMNPFQMPAGSGADDEPALLPASDGQQRIVPSPATAAAASAPRPGSPSAFAAAQMPLVPAALSALSSPVKLLTVLSLLMRSLEQISSDCGYLARYVFLAWDSDRLSYEYKRWKSLSLTCAAIVEVMFLVRFIVQRRRAAAGSSDAAAAPAAPDANRAVPSQVVSSPASSQAPNAPPLVHSAKECKYRFQALNTDAAISPRDAVISATVAVRCLCDMYIYYRWMPSWSPPEYWQYWAGTVSAVLGIGLVLDETIRETQTAAVKAQIAKEKRA